MEGICLGIGVRLALELPEQGAVLSRSRLNESLLHLRAVGRAVDRDGQIRHLVAVKVAGRVQPAAADRLRRGLGVPEVVGAVNRDQEDAATACIASSGLRHRRFA